MNNKSSNLSWNFLINIHPDFFHINPIIIAHVLSHFITETNFNIKFHDFGDLIIFSNIVVNIWLILHFYKDFILNLHNFAILNRRVLGYSDFNYC